MILSSHREWLAVVAELPESELPCNQSTVAYAVGVARRAVEAYDDLLEHLDELLQEDRAVEDVPVQGALL